MIQNAQYATLTECGAAFKNMQLGRVLALKQLNLFAVLERAQYKLALFQAGNFKSVASGGGNAGTFPPPLEIGNIVVEIWCYLPEVYTFGAESEIQEIFSKQL